MLLPKSGRGKQEQVGEAAGCHISLLSMSNRLCNSTNANTKKTQIHTNTNTIKFENSNTKEKFMK